MNVVALCAVSSLTIVLPSWGADGTDLASNPRRKCGVTLEIVEQRAEPIIKRGDPGMEAIEHGIEGGVVLKPCHYPHLFLFRFRASTPSHIHINRCQPRQMVCQPGAPSCRRARNPPTRATAIRAFHGSNLPWVDQTFPPGSPARLRQILGRPPARWGAPAPATWHLTTSPPPPQHGHQRLDFIRPFHLAVFHPRPGLEGLVKFLHPPTCRIAPDDPAHFSPPEAGQRG